MAGNSVNFKNVQHYGDPLIMEELEVNMKHWFDWAFLGIGAWTNVDSSTSGINGGSFANLNTLEDNVYSYNQIFFGLRKDWVYETGVNYRSPKQTISSITYEADEDKYKVTLGNYETSNFNINDIVVFDDAVITGQYTVCSGVDSKSFLIEHPSTGSSLILESQSGITITTQSGSNILLGIDFGPTGAGGTVQGIYNPTPPKIYVDSVETGSGYTIDYPNGKVIFDQALSSTNTVSADYSYRNVQSYVGNQSNLFFEIQYDSQNPANNSWASSATSGDYATDPSQRMQLPAVLIECVAQKKSEGYELGSGRLKIDQDVLVTVVSENKYERNIITDILSEQKHKTINLYDIDVLNKRNQNSLNYDGSLNESGLMYNQISADNTLQWSKAYFKDVVTSEVETNNPNLHMSKVRFKAEVIR